MKTKKLGEVNQHSMTVLYGDPGSGKTYFALNNTPYKTLYINTIDDDGLLNIEDENDNITVKMLDDGANLSKDLNAIIKDLKDNNHDYENIIVDPFNYLQDDLEVRIAEASPTKSLQIQDWQTIIKSLKKTILALNSLKKKYNVILIMHTKTKDIFSDKGTATTTIRPSVNDNVANYAAGLSSGVIYFYRQKDKFFVDMGDNKNVMSKVRKNYKQLKKENYTIEKLLKGEE